MSKLTNKIVEIAKSYVGQKEIPPNKGFEDKEFEKKGDDEEKEYFDKLLTLCNKYRAYCNFSFLYDYNGLLQYKDSPIDKGPNTFLKLLKLKIEV